MFIYDLFYGNLLCLCFSTRKITTTKVVGSKSVVAPTATTAPTMMGKLSMPPDEMVLDGVRVTAWDAELQRYK